MDQADRIKEQVKAQLKASKPSAEELRREKQEELGLKSPLTDIEGTPEDHPVRDARRVWDIIVDNWEEWVKDSIEIDEEIGREKALWLPVDRIVQASIAKDRLPTSSDEETEGWAAIEQAEKDPWKYPLTPERAERGICLLIALRHLKPVEYEIAIAMKQDGHDRLHPTGSKEPFAPYMIVRSNKLPESHYQQLVRKLAPLPAPIELINCVALARKADNLEEFREFCEVLYQICRKQSQMFHKTLPDELKDRSNPS